MELGNGFTFIGNQHVLEYNGKESKVDMLFFHRGLRCLVAVDLKIGEFKPEYAGKMNYYLSLLDRLEKEPDENCSIGIILCAEKDKVEVELAMHGKRSGVLRLLIELVNSCEENCQDGLRGFSTRSIRKMRVFYEYWAQYLILPPTAAKMQVTVIDAVIDIDAFSLQKWQPMAAEIQPRVELYGCGGIEERCFQATKYSCAYIKNGGKLNRIKV